MTAQRAIFSDTTPQSDLERWRRATEQMIAIGGDVAWAGEQISEQISARVGPPDSANRLRRRDAAVVVLAEFYLPELRKLSVRAIAHKIATETLRYECGRWKVDGGLGGTPTIDGAENAALYAILANSPASGAPKFEAVRKILAASAVGKTIRTGALALTQSGAHDSRRVVEQEHPIGRRAKAERKRDIGRIGAAS